MLWLSCGRCRQLMNQWITSYPTQEILGVIALRSNDYGFRLSSWLRSVDSDGRFDEYDPITFDTDRTRVIPAGAKTLPILHPNCILSWSDESGIAFSYERWKNRRNQRSEEYRGHGIRTEGHRLFADISEVLQLLKKSNRDLIFEVRISRSRGGARYQTRKEDKHIELEGRFDGIILLRGDGSLHTADGCIGAWPLPG